MMAGSVLAAGMASVGAGVGWHALVVASLSFSTGLATAFVHNRRSALAAAEETRVHSSSNERILLAINNMTNGLIMCGKERLVEVVNDKFHAMYDLEPGLIKRGWTLAQVVEACQSKVAVPLRSSAVLEAALGAAVDRRTSSYIDLETGKGSVYELWFEPLVDGGSVISIADVTDKRKAVGEIVRRANFDGLTGLPNRTSFGESLKDAIADASKGGPAFSVHCLDLDHFKEVNDTMGHPFGDALLVQVASHLRSTVGGDDVVARLGGDEFVVLQFTRGDEDADVCLAERMIKRVSAPYSIEGNDVVVGLSVGVVRSRQGTSSDDLLKRADLALYRAKESGRAGYCVFEEAMTREADERSEMERDIRNALGRDELTVFYQPVVDASTGEVRSFEALVRWLHPTKGMVPPCAFVPLAEATGTMVEIGEFVLRRACTDALAWPSNVSVSVNLSRVQFKRGVVVEQVDRALTASGLMASRLELEVPESLAATDAHAVRQAIDKVRDMGVSVTLSGFGNGLSSLSNLRGFPFDKFKVDRTAVSDMGTDATSEAFVGLMAQLLRTLGKVMVVGGVETSEQAESLKGAGVARMQGNGFARPKSAKELSLDVEMSMATSRKFLRVV